MNYDAQIRGWYVLDRVSPSSTKDAILVFREDKYSKA